MQVADIQDKKSTIKPYESLKTDLLVQGWKIGEAAAEIDLTPEGLKRGIEKGSLKVESINKLAYLLHSSAGDVISKYFPADKNQPEKAGQSGSVITKIPAKYDRLSGSPPPLAQEGIPGYDLELAKTDLMLDELLRGTPTAYIKVPGNERATFAILNRGDAMYKHYKNGDWLPCRVLEDHDDIEYGRAYFIVTSQTRVVRRIHPGETDDSFLLVADNESKTDSGKRKYPDYHIKRTRIKGLAMICGGVTTEDI